ncbi:MAG: AI-2E family transporter [Polaromonas sp.]
MAKVQIQDGPGLIAVVVNTVRSVSIGVAGTAAAQGILSTIGFLVTGVPGVVLLGFLTFFLALVQLPTVLVWLPAVLWLYYQHQEGWALFMLIWGLVAVGAVDNFLRPYLISQGAKLPIAIIFMGVIGGLLAWGMIGLFIGPTLLAVAFSLLRGWVGAARAA